jgi:hypothetical protein
MASSATAARVIASITPQFPHVDEDDKRALLAERSRLINALATIEEALREKHGTAHRTV